MRNHEIDVRAGHFRGVAYLLREAQSSLSRTLNITDVHKTRLTQLADQLSAPDALNQLLQALNVYNVAQQTATDEGDEILADQDYMDAQQAINLEILKAMRAQNVSLATTSSVSILRRQQSTGP